jgi:DNA repair exonuclease SbcCD ATPase subunit
MILPEKDLKEFIEKTKKEINDLGNNTFKAYQILQHFFEHEAYSIAQNIKRIDNLLKELEKNISDYNLENTKKIRLGIKEFKDSIIKKEELKNTVKNIESKINKLEKEKRQLFEEISQKQKSDEYKDYYRLEVEQYKIKEDIEELKAEFLHHFSVLEHSLKKHLKVSFEDEKLLAKYVENPISALLEDENLDIINILKKVENNILKDIIELKDKKKEKTLETINQINHEKINPFLDEYKKITEKLKKVSEKMGSCSVLDEIEKIKKKFDEKRDEIEKVKKDLEDANKNLLDIDLNKIKKELKEKIDDFLNVDLSLDQE